MDKKQLYESIMRNVAREVKKTLNEDNGLLAPFSDFIQLSIDPINYFYKYLMLWSLKSKGMLSNENLDNIFKNNSFVLNRDVQNNVIEYNIYNGIIPVTIRYKETKDLISKIDIYFDKDMYVHSDQAQLIEGITDSKLASKFKKDLKEKSCGFVSKGNFSENKQECYKNFAIALKKVKEDIADINDIGWALDSIQVVLSDIRKNK